MRDELSPQARALLRASRSFDDPSAADTRRVRASVLARVGTAAGVGAAIGVTTSALSFGGVFGSTASKIGAAMVLVAGLSAGTYVVTTHRAHAPAVSQTMPASLSRSAAQPVMPMPKLEDKAELPAQPLELGTRVRPPINRPHVRRATPDLEGEVSLLEAADAELRRGDSDAALARLAEHAAKYPSGALVYEREGVRAIALCRSGRVAEGRAVADRFLGSARKSSLATRVRTACAIDKPVD
jgi:hypothetical protein